MKKKTKEQISLYKKTITDCLKKTDEETNIKTSEDFIKTLMVDYFKNPKLFETINYLGEAK